MIYIIITFMKWRAENFRILAELSWGSLHKKEWIGCVIIFCSQTNIHQIENNKVEILFHRTQIFWHDDLLKGDSCGKRDLLSKVSLQRTLQRTRTGEVWQEARVGCAVSKSCCAHMRVTQVQPCCWARIVRCADTVPLRKHHVVLVTDND
jgi:hypothetical protein